MADFCLTGYRAVLMRDKDMSFPPEDSACEVEHIPGAELRPIPSLWGHVAGGGADPAAAAMIDASIREWLAR